MPVSHGTAKDDLELWRIAMTKEQMAERLADKVNILGLSRVSVVFMLSQLRVTELQSMLEAYGIQAQIAKMVNQ